jgi:peptidoglycan-N-acetylglucosamine deacetylase
MAPHTKQVFSTPSPKRWHAAKLIFFTIIGCLCVSCIILVINYTYYFKPNLPKNYLNLEAELAQISKDTSLSWADVALESCCSSGRPTCFAPLSKNNNMPLDKQIRAGFAVNWDPQSYFTLLNHIDQLNMVLPEWFFLSDADTVVFKPDTRTYKLLEEHPSVSVVPLLSNFWNGKWNAKNATRIFNNQENQEKFINSLVHTLKHYGFKGVNIDFEGLEENTSEKFYSFLKILHNRLNTEGLLLTQSIVPYNNQYSPEKLAEVNDLLFVMAYNQHYQTGKAGSIADQKWVETIMKSVSKNVPSSKLVLCIADYGLDWSKKGKDAEAITYRAALSIAQEAAAEIKFDTTTYNLEYKYTDDEYTAHKVFFVDAVTNFNQIRSMTNLGWRGVALWRLGAEDPRLWAFYGKDLSHEGLKNGSFNIQNLTKTISGEGVNYIGMGEVTDIMTEPNEGTIRFAYDTTHQLFTEEYYDKLPTSYVVQRFGKMADKKLVLSFDDGPDKVYTKQVLDILKAENTPASFFLIGRNMEKNQDLVKRIYNEGHEIGNHTFGHVKLDSLSSWSADLELSMTRRSLESMTGHSTILFRPPYNQYQEPETRDQLQSFILAKKHNYLTVNESIDPRDWEKGITCDTIIKRIELNIDKRLGHIILLHDAGGNRDSTIAALPKIIHYFKKKGYTFTSISDLIGRSKADLMPIVAAEQKLLVKLNRYVNDGIMGLENGLYWIFYIAIGLSILRSLFILFFAMLQRRKQKTPFPEFTAPLSIIVPAYNEEVNAVSTVMSLLQQRYAKFEIVFIDDGSQDDTFQRVKQTFFGHPKVQVWTKPNGGKASALNFGLQKSRYDFVVCIDADTQLDPNALSEIMKPFKDPSVGAVAGNVRVGNQRNWLTKWQSIEYITAQNFDRMAFAYLNCITVVPGAIGAFRRSAIVDEPILDKSKNYFGSGYDFSKTGELTGAYATDTLAEDCDLTIRILKKGYVIAQNNNAIAITESPETIGEFLKQRFRWTFGVMQAFWKNKEVLFRPQYKSLGMIAFPNILIFQFIIPIFAPLADLILMGMVINWATSDPIAVGNLTFWEQYNTIILYCTFLFFDLLCSGVALKYENTSLRNLWMIIPQRFVYRPFMYFVLFKSFAKAIKGEMQGWGTLKRTGNMGQLPTEMPSNKTKPVNIAKKEKRHKRKEEVAI